MIAEIIINNSGDKDIVFWGGRDNTELIREVEKVKKIKFVSVSPNTTKISGVCEHIASLSGKRDKYYVVVFPKETQDIRDMFKRFGYLADDVFYVNHLPVAVHNDGTDKYGNVVKGIEKYGRKVQLYLEGYGANVTLGEKISIDSTLKINVASEFEVTIGDRCKFQENFSIVAKNLDENRYAEIKIGENCNFVDGFIKSYSGRIYLDNNSTYGRNFYIAACYGISVNIGKDCMFSHDIYILGGDGHTLYDTERNKVLNSVESIPNEKKRVVIGNHVWVGLRTVILNGCNIGDGSMIGAVSVVKRRCSNNCMLAGNPAKVLRKNIAWSRNPMPVDGAEMLDAERQYYNLTAEEGELYEC